MANIELAKVRRALSKDGRTHFKRIRKGLHLGYRRSTETWIARGFVPVKAGEKRKSPLLHERIGSDLDLTYDEARERAEEWFKEMRGDAPLGYTVLQAIEDYARTKSANLADPSSANVFGDLYTLTKHITGELLARPVADLATDELERWRDSIKVKPGSRRRVFTMLAAALSNAHRLHGVGDLGTWRRVKHVKIPRAERSRLFIPTDKELNDLLAMCDPDFARLVRAALHTGCRYGELTALEVRDFDAERGVLTLRVSKTGERDVLLSSAAVTFFREQVKNKTPRARIFTTDDGEPWRKSMQHKRMRAATKIRAFVFYSLRHLALSRQLSAGIPSPLVAKNSGTSEAMLRTHYHKIVPADRSLFDRVPALA